MKEIHLKDDLDVTVDEELDLVVTDYTAGSYDGSGDALGYSSKSNRVYHWNLSHCSCYGPFDGGPMEYLLEDFLDFAGSVYNEWSDELDATFRLELRS